MPCRALLAVLVLLVSLALPASALAAEHETAAEHAREVAAEAHGQVDPGDFLPLRARFGTRKPADDIDLPGGELHIAGAELLPGPDRVVLTVTLDRAAPGAKLLIDLPRPFGERSAAGVPFTRAPTLDPDAPAGVGLARSGSRVALTLTGLPVHHDLDVTLKTVALPAGSYALPVTWQTAAGTQRSAGTIRLVSYALTREGLVDPDADSTPNGFANPLRDPMAGVEVDSSGPDSGDDESETFDTVDPIDGDRVATAANDITDISRGVYLSNNSGRSFSAPRFPKMADVQGSNSPEVESLSGDPILAADRLGNVWAGGLSVCNSTGAHSHIFVGRIAAGTTSFVPLLVALPYLHTATGCAQSTAGLQDKPQMTVDDAPSSATYGRLYVSWDDPDPSGGVNEVVDFCDTRVARFPQAVRCDNADNWVGPVVTSSAPGSYITSDPATGPDGTVYEAWWDYSADNQISITACRAAVADCSKHASWSTPKAAVALTADPATGGPIPFGCPINAQPGGRAAPVPSLAVDHSGGPRNGQLYLGWSDLRTDSGATRCQYAQAAGTPPASTHETWDSFVATAPSLSALLASGDRSSAAVGTSILGDTATSPASAANSDDWFPWVAVDQTSGQAYVDVYSTTGDATRDTVNTYLGKATPAAGTKTSYSDLRKVSAAASDYSITGTSGCCAFGNDYGDYTGNAAAEGVAYPVFTSRPNASAPGRVLLYVPAAASPEVVLQHVSFTDAYGAGGDGAVEPGEAFTLVATLTNTGPAGATNLQGTLSSSFSQVTLTQANSAYPDLATNASAPNETAFTGTLDPLTPCGVVIDLLLTVTTTQGPERVPVPVTVTCGPNQIPSSGPTSTTGPTSSGPTSTTGPSTTGTSTTAPTSTVPGTTGSTTTSATTPAPTTESTTAPASTDAGTATTPPGGSLTAPATPATPGTPGAGAAATPVTCVAGGGFRTVSVTPAGRGLRFAVTRKQARPFTVDVFQQAQGRQVLDQRLVARFTGKTGSFTWSGGTNLKHKLTSGYYFVRLTMKLAKGSDVRRSAFSRPGTGFVKRPDFYARAACKVFSSLKLSGPTWGGANKRPLGIALRLLHSGTASILVQRGGSTIKRTTISATGTGTKRLSLPAAASRAGDYTVTVTGTAGGQTEKVRLVSRRL